MLIAGKRMRVPCYPPAMVDTRAIALIMALRGQGITDARVLSAIELMPRELFVDEPFETSAYDNSALPIACGQTISQPYMVAYSRRSWTCAEAIRVLEIGTGSGYQAAVLAHLCRMIYTVERHKPLMRRPMPGCTSSSCTTSSPAMATASSGWPEQAPFDRIMLTAAIPEVPQTLIEQLKVGGILIAPVGKPVSSGKHFARLGEDYPNRERGRARRRSSPWCSCP